MRLMQTIAGSPHGGAESFFVRLAIALTRTDIEQRIVMRRDPARTQALRAAGLGPVELSFGGPADWRTRAEIRRIAEAYRPEIVLTWMNRAAKHTPAGDYVLVGRMGGYYSLKYYGHCDHLIGNTPDIVDYLVREGWPAQKAHYVPNFVTVPQTEPLARAALQTPDDAPLLLAAGRLHANKAFDDLLRALPQLPGAWLWLAGDGPEQSPLARLAAELGVADRVRFLGWRDDLPALLAACDVFVCPSRHEPLGNAIIEAWAAGKPVIAAASEGPWFLIDDGISGWLVPVGDVGALAGAIGEALTDPDRRRSRAAAGHARYRAEFSETVVVARYLEFLRRVVEPCAA